LLVEDGAVHGVYVDNARGRAAAEADRLWLAGDVHVASLRVEAWAASTTPRHAGRVMLPNKPAQRSRIPLGWARVMEEVLADLRLLTGGFEVLRVHDRDGRLYIDLDLASIAQDKRDEAQMFVAAIAEDSAGLCAVCGHFAPPTDRDFDHRPGRCRDHRHAPVDFAVLDWSHP